MWAAILSAFPTIAGWINLIIGYFQQQAADQTAATNAEGAAEQQHQNDGAQSVADHDSNATQNSALDGIEQQLKNPVQVPVTVQPTPPTETK
jgi:hypothetical protein